MHLSGKKILITGGSRGLGKATIKQLLEKGAHVTSVSRTKPSHIHHHLTHVEYDMNSIYTDTQRIDFLKETEFDVLINNVGSSPGLINFQKLDEEKITATLNINVLSHVWFTKNIKYKKVVFVGSVCSYITVPEAALYCASKNFIHSFATALRMEGEDVYIIYPGKINTDLFPQISDLFVSRKENIASYIVNGIEKEWKTAFIPFFLGFLPIAQSIIPRFIYEKILTKVFIWLKK